MDNKEKVQITTTLPADIVKKLKVLCAEEGRNMNFYLERWIKQELAKLGK